MTKVYFFEKRNPTTGELTGEIIDTDERIAWDYYCKPRFFDFIGYSDGSELEKLRKELTMKRSKETNMGVQPTKATRERILEAQAKELEKARQNPDKTPPRNLTRMQFGNPTRNGTVLPMQQDLANRFK